MAVSKMFLSSVLLNICALAYVVSQRSVVPSVSEKNIPSASATAQASGKGAGSNSLSAPSGKYAGFQWSMVESDDYRKYIASLRAIGCPEETIKDIIIADVNKLYAPKLAALNTQTAGPFHYWETYQYWDMRGEELVREKQRAAIEKEKADLIKELLGVNLDEEWRKLRGEPDYNAWRLGFLDKDKREAARKIQQKYSELEQQVYCKSRDNLDADDMAELGKIRQDQQAELAQLLTPQELYEYNLRFSQTAGLLRGELTLFSPSEDEFRKMYEIASRYQSPLDRTSGYDTDHPELAEERAAVKKQLDDDLQKALGDRYADYVKGNDENYRALDNVTKKYDLPAGTTDKVYTMKQTAEQAVAKIRQDTSLTDDQRTAALQAVRTETVTAVQEALGEKGFKMYQRSGGYWLGGLAAKASR